MRELFWRILAPSLADAWDRGFHDGRSNRYLTDNPYRAWLGGGAKGLSMMNDRTRAVCTYRTVEEANYDLPERPTARTGRGRQLPAEQLVLRLISGRATEVWLTGSNADVAFYRNEQMPPWVRATLEPLHPGAFDGWNEHR